MTCSRGVRCLALLPLLGALAFLRISGQTSPTSVHGLLMVREIGQTDRPAANVHVRALDAGGNTQDVSDSNATGGFSLRVPGTISIYRLLIEDIYNRWWPVERNDLKNDPQHANLAPLFSTRRRRRLRIPAPSGQPSPACAVSMRSPPLWRNCTSIWASPCLASTPSLAVSAPLTRVRSIRPGPVSTPPSTPA